VIVRLTRAARAALAIAGRDRQHCVLVSVLHIEGSAPREAGAAMQVTLEQVHGTIGGGHLELKSVAIARELLQAGLSGCNAGSVTHRFPLGPALGQCCGGIAHIRFDVCAAGYVPQALEVQAPESLFELRLFGAGHVGQALVNVLAEVDCDITWIDSREQQFPTLVPANASIEFCEAPQEEVAAAAPGTFYLVMTHSHALDLAIVERILERGDAGLVGLIGSHTKRITFERRLRAKGFCEQAIESLVCPIGVPGVSGKAPGVVAIAVAAQLLAQVSSQRATRSASTADNV